VRLTSNVLTTMVLVTALASAACGRTDLGRSPSQVVIDSMEGASGAKPGDFSGFVQSDVVTMVKQTVGSETVNVPTIFNDTGRAKFRLILRDAGSTQSPTTPTAVNAVTFNTYQVRYIRTDGRNQQGVDVPYGFTSQFTVTVPAGGEATAPFELVRHTAKMEAPLAALTNNPTIISTIAEVTFYGKDLAGNEVVATGSIGVSFGNFGDPQ